MIRLKGFFCILAILITLGNSYAGNNGMKIKLDVAHFKQINFATLLEKRYSCRSFQAKALNLDELAAIMWATCGKKFDSVTSATRTAPSAGATYPLELYVVVGENSVDKLKPGVYHYIIEEHSLELIGGGERRAALAQACLGQNFINDAPVSLVITAKFNRTTQRYGARGQNYVYMEVGSASQNAYLAAGNLGLGTVAVGAFIDDKVAQALGLDKDCAPLIVMPIGYAK